MNGEKSLAFIKKMINTRMEIKKDDGSVEFLEKGMKIINNNGQIAMFLKIQVVEGGKRKELFKLYPPKYVYVFSKRQNPWRNGSPVDEKGKPWSSTMCFAWFILEKGFTGEPIIRWL